MQNSLPFPSVVLPVERTNTVTSLAAFIDSVYYILPLSVARNTKRG